MVAAAAETCPFPRSLLRFPSRLAFDGAPLLDNVDRENPLPAVSYPGLVGGLSGPRSRTDSSLSRTTTRRPARPRRSRLRLPSAWRTQEAVGPSGTYGRDRDLSRPGSSCAMAVRKMSRWAKLGESCGSLQLPGRHCSGASVARDPWSTRSNAAG